MIRQSTFKNSNWINTIPQIQAGTALPPGQILLRLPGSQRLLSTQGTVKLCPYICKEACLTSEYMLHCSNLFMCRRKATHQLIMIHVAEITNTLFSHWNNQTSTVSTTTILVVWSMRSNLGLTNAWVLSVSLCKQHFQQNHPHRQRWCCPRTSAHPHSAGLSRDLSGVRSSHQL